MSAVKFWAFTDCNGCRVMDQIVEHNCSCRIFSCWKNWIQINHSFIPAFAHNRN